jgi:hypothetical protein
MTLTPRQLAAYMEFSEQVDRLERAQALRIAALGAQGDSQAIKQELEDLSGG